MPATALMDSSLKIALFKSSDRRLTNGARLSFEILALCAAQLFQLS